MLTQRASSSQGVSTSRGRNHVGEARRVDPSALDTEAAEELEQQLGYIVGIVDAGRRVAPARELVVALVAAVGPANR